MCGSHDRLLEKTKMVVTVVFVVLVVVVEFGYYDRLVPALVLSLDDVRVP